MSLQKLVSLDIAAQMLSLSPRSLSDKRFRAKLGLPAVKIGKALRFSEIDLEKVISRGREVLPLRK